MLTTAATLLLFKAALFAGLALWMSLLVVNNTTAFKGGVAALGGLMGMQLFDQAPALPSPLLARRVRSVAWHRVAFTAVLLAEIGVATLMAVAALQAAGALAGQVGTAQAVAWGNLAFAAFLGLGFMLALGGAWFAYYVRQEGMQITHWVLIGTAIAGTLVNNLAVS